MELIRDILPPGVINIRMELNSGALVTNKKSIEAALQVYNKQRFSNAICH
jgi:hypothetical protein